MPLKVFEKLTEYLHVVGRENEPPRGSDWFDRLFKIRPVLNVIAKILPQYYKPSRDQVVDEGLIAFTGHLSYIQHMPAKLIKYGIKLWLRWDSNYLHQFDVVLMLWTSSLNHFVEIIRCALTVCTLLCHY